jgi:hypothetical protein
VIGRVIWLESLRGRGQSKDLVIDGKIILTCIFGGKCLKSMD